MFSAHTVVYFILKPLCCIILVFLLMFYLNIEIFAFL